MCDCITSLSTTIRRQTRQQRHGQPQLLQPQLKQRPVIIYVVHDWEGIGWQRRRDRAQTMRVSRRLGHRFVFSFFIVLTNILCIYRL